MNNRTGYLMKNTALFALGNLGTKIISFFLIPLYTKVLTTEQYGIVDLVVTISTIVVPILSLNIAEAVMRFNLDKDADKDKITKIGITILIDKVSDLRLMVYFYIVFSASTQVLLYDLRGKELLLYYSVGNILQTLLIACFNVIFLMIFNWGIKGYLLAYIMSFAIISVYALIVGKGYKAIKVPIDRTKMIEMLKYSIVLIPNSFMWWIMNSSDHIMVTAMVGAAANGIYAISYKLPTLITTFTSIFNQAWSYSAIREEGATDEEEYNNMVFKNIISISMLIGTGMLCVIKPFLAFYVSKDYYISWRYTPFLIIGLVYLTLGSFMSTSYTVHKDSFGFLFSGMLGAILNIVLNFTLIPFIKVYGAAFATCISYVAVFIFRVFHTRKYIYYNVINIEFIIYAQLIHILCVLVVFWVYKDTWKSYLKVLVKLIKRK